MGTFQERRLKTHPAIPSFRVLQLQSTTWGSVPICTKRDITIPSEKSFRRQLASASVRLTHRKNRGHPRDKPQPETRWTSAPNNGRGGLLSLMASRHLGVGYPDFLWACVDETRREDKATTNGGCSDEVKAGTTRHGDPPPYLSGIFHMHSG